MTHTDPLQLAIPAPEVMDRMTILPVINTDLLRPEILAVMEPLLAKTIRMEAAGRLVSVIKSRVGHPPPRFTHSSH
jgi:hypothetical protein